MARPRVTRDPFRPLDLAAALWSTAAAVPPVSAGTSAALWTAFATLRRVLIGRRVTVRAGGGPVTMTVTELDSPLDLRRLLFGPLSEVGVAAVRVAATDIDWGAGSFEHASAVLRNVYVRPGVPPVMVAAPVEFTLDVPTAALDTLLLTMAPRFAGRIDDDGIARVRWARLPHLGEVEVDAGVDGTALSLKPRAVMLGGRRWKLPSRVPAYRIRLPELPHGLQLGDIRFAPGLLQLTATLPKWRMDLSRRHVEHLEEF